MDECLLWLRYSLNPEADVPIVSNWKAVLAFADKQALTGICFPARKPENIDNELFFQWIGTIQLIEQRNILLNKRIERLFGMLEQDGFKCCLLKGQGNAEMYPNPLRRCPGDIDVWVNTDEKTAYQYVQERFPDEVESYKHIHFPIFEDASVDVHITPLKFYNGSINKKLQCWIDRNKKTQFFHAIRLTETHRDVCVPTGYFNVVYQLGHMLIHLFDEGLGLRQVVDYFYVMKNLEVSQEKRKELISTIRNLGMMKFARAVMWIEHEVFGLSKEMCLVEPDERRGKLLLNDIVEAGNFGHYSERYHGKSGFYYRGMVETWRNMRLLSIAPREGTARLRSRMKTAIRHVIRQ